MASSVKIGWFTYSLNARTDYPYVHASIRSTPDPNSSAGESDKYWTMRLQRRDTHGGWSTLGTRTGFVSLASPSDRTFSNIASGGRPLRVWVSFDGTSNNIFYYL